MSTAFRITQRTVQQRTLSNLAINLDSMSRLQERLSSGRLINRPSDSPTGTVSAMQHRGDISRVQQYSRNAIDGENWLSIADSTLQQMTSVVQRVRELVLQGANGSMGQKEREAIATEVDSLRSNLVDFANTRYLDRPIFSGTAAVPDSYDPTGAYLGDVGNELVPGTIGKVNRLVAPGVTVRVNLTGPEIFGDQALGNDLFQTVAQIANDLRTSPTNLSADLVELDGHIDTMSNSMAKIGARQRQVEAMHQRADDNVNVLKNGLSEIEDIDLPKTMVDLQLQQVAYQAALNATARVIQPSLMDFLR